MAPVKIILIAVVFITGCSGDAALSGDPPSNIEPSLNATAVPTASSQVIELRYDETVSYEGLDFRWLALTDSRCPVGVNCVWAGQMEVTIEVTGSAKEAVEVELLRRATREPEVSHVFDYELRLQNITPHPKANITYSRSDYVMRFEITK